MATKLFKHTEKIILGTGAVWGNTNDWHHVGVVAGNAVAVAADVVAVVLRLAAVVEPRVNHDVAQLALVVALFHGTAVVVVYVVVDVVGDGTVVVVYYGRQLLILRSGGGLIAFLRISSSYCWRRRQRIASAEIVDYHVSIVFIICEWMG